MRLMIKHDYLNVNIDLKPITIITGINENIKKQIKMAIQILSGFKKENIEKFRRNIMKNLHENENFEMKLLHEDKIIFKLTKDEIYFYNKLFKEELIKTSKKFKIFYNPENNLHPHYQHQWVIRFMNSVEMDDKNKIRIIFTNSPYIINSFNNHIVGYLNEKEVGYIDQTNWLDPDNVSIFNIEYDLKQIKNQCWYSAYFYTKNSKTTNGILGNSKMNEITDEISDEFNKIIFK